MSGKTNAKPSQLGNFFQYVLALELILNSAEDAVLFIEEFGDISINNQAIEVKHHQNQNKLGEKDIEFWKTLFNWCNDSSTFLTYDKLILHTTSEIIDTNIFFDWNTFSKEKKKNIVLNIIETGSSNKSLGKYFSFIQNMEEDKLSAILDKIFLSFSNPNIQDKIGNIIKENSLFKTVKNIHNRKDLFSYLLGVLGDMYIFGDSIKVADFWTRVRPQINRYKEFEFVINPYSNEELKDSTVNKYQNHNFIQELKDISIDESIQIKSMKEFLYSKNIFLENAKNEVLLNDLNNKIVPKIIEKSNIKKAKNIISKNSFDLFFEVTDTMDVIQSDYFENNQEFQNGNIHNEVNEKNFSWLYI